MKQNKPSVGKTHQQGGVLSLQTRPVLFLHCWQGPTNSDGSRKNLLLPADKRGKKIIHSRPKSNLCRWVLRQVSHRLPLETTKQALKNPLYF